MGFGTGLMKTLMFVFNGIVWVLGIVLFVVGIVVLVEGKNWNDIIDGKTVPVSVLLIVVGLVIAVVGFLGCFGAMKQNGNMLLLYAVILGLIILVQLVAGILAFIFSDEMEGIIETNMPEFLNEYTGDAEDSTKDATMNWIMEEFDCCGVKNYKDFAKDGLTVVANWNQLDVPDSCCVDMTSGCGLNYFDADGNVVDSRLTENPVNEDGCMSKVLDSVTQNLNLVGIVALVFFAIEILQICFAVALRRQNKGVLA